MACWSQRSKWDSFTHRKYKINLIRSLAFRIYSFPELLQSDLNELRKLLLQNGYPLGTINYNINGVLKKNKDKLKSPIVSTVPKKDLLISLPYLGFQSGEIAKSVKSCVCKFYSFVNLKETTI